MACCLVFGSDLHPAIACFDGPIVTRLADRRKKRPDGIFFEQLGERIADEVATVVTLENQWRAVKGEEDGEGIASGLGGGVCRRQPQELVAAGQVADREHKRRTVVDGTGRIGEVGGPDGTGAFPLDGVEFVTSLFGLLDLEVPNDVGDLPAGKVGELCLDGRHAGVCPGLAEVLEDSGAGRLVGELSRASAGMDGEAVVVPVVLPISEGAC